MEQNQKFRWWLSPFSVLYGIAVYIRNLMFDLKILPSKEFDVPVISVGNITVGGTGKTPHVEYLVRLFRKNYRVATLSRGYKRKSHGFMVAEKESTVYDVGDEPKQIKNKFPDITVAVEKNRAKGIKKLIHKFGTNLILLDDAFQHRWVEPELSILLIDFNRPIDQDKLLPLGNLRESFHEKRRAHVVIITKTPSDIKPIDQRIIVKNLNLFPYQAIFFTNLKHGSLTPIFPENNKKIDESKLKKMNYSIVLLTGIANPSHLYDYTKTLSNDLIHLRYADHHFFTQKEISNMAKTYNEIKNENKIIVTTEKDAVRIQGMKNIPDEIKANSYYIPLEITFENNNKEEFDRLILKFVQKGQKSMYFKRDEMNFNS